MTEVDMDQIRRAKALSFAIECRSKETAPYILALAEAFDKYLKTGERPAIKYKKAP
jgi:hypothetical protein